MPVLTCSSVFLGAGGNSLVPKDTLVLQFFLKSTVSVLLQSADHLAVVLPLYML